MIKYHRLRKSFIHHVVQRALIIILEGCTSSKFSSRVHPAAERFAMCSVFNGS